MSNYLKTLNVTFTPPSGGWDGTAKTKTLSNPISGSNIIDDTFGLWPETTYTITANAVDSYDQAVTVTIASQSYETKRDFPAFHNMSAGHAILTAKGHQSGEELNVFNNRKNKTYGLNPPDTLFTSVTDGNTVSDGSKNQLNGAFLNASSFKVEYLSDYSDPNIYDLEDPTNWIHLSGVSDIATSRYEAYYDFNSFIPKADAAIEFDSYNKKLGVYAIGANLYKGVLGTNQTVTPITLAATPVKSGISPTAVCTDTNAFFNSIDEGDADAGKDLAIPRPAAASGAITYPVGYVYKTKVDDPSAAVIEEETVDGDVSVLGISANEWRNNEEDAVWTLDIKATTPHKTGSSYNVPTESDMRINLWTLFPPRQVLKKVVINSGTQALNEVQFSNQNWYAESPDKTSINFIGRNVPSQGDDKVGYFNFSTETDSRRPFLPLVHKNLDVSNRVFGFVPGFDTEDDSNDHYESFFIANDPIGAYPDDGDICTFGTAFIVEGLFKPLGSNEARAILSNPCDPELNWKVLTMHDTEASLTTGKIDDDFYEAVMDNKTKVGDISNDIGFSTDSIDNFDRALSTGTGADRNFTQTIYRTSWPEYNTTIDYNTSAPLGSGTNFYQELIPGRYYAFKVTSANYAGISSKPFIIKTAEAESSTLITMINSDPATTGTNTQPGTHQIGSISIQIGSTLPIDVTFQLGAGTQIANNSVIEITDNAGHTYTSQGAASWNGTSPAFSTSGTYTLTITSPTTKLANDDSGVVILPIIHTYTITVTDSNSLSVTTSSASNVGIDSATLNGSWSKTGSHNVTAEGFKWWVTSAGENTATTVPVSGTASSFSNNLSSLNPNTSYTYKAYATSDDTTIGTNGTVWGQPVSFTTDSNVNPVNLDFGQITRTTGTITVS